MAKFKIGDRVRRVGKPHTKGHWPVGKEGVISDFAADGFAILQDDFPCMHDPEYLELTETPQGPVRTKTVREIVDGIYNRVKVFNLHGVSDKRIGVRLTSNNDNANMVSMDATELRAAALVLTQLAEALEE